jgi:hypothetical protein
MDEGGSFSTSLPVCQAGHVRTGRAALYSVMRLMYVTTRYIGSDKVYIPADNDD